MQEKPAPKKEISKGRYELTLSEFPFVLLSKIGKNKSIEYIEYRDTINGDKNELVERVWKVYPDGRWGFGTATTLSTFYELFQIWKEQNFENKLITFGTIYSLVKRKGIKPSKSTYDSIKRDLRVLTGIVIEAKNAFWDNEKRAYVDAYFHLFERTVFYKEHKNQKITQMALPFSYIEASDELYGSVLANSLMVTEFDSQFFHALKPTEQRLVLYLSKMLRNQAVHKRDVMKLAEQLPLTTKVRKKAKQQIKLAAQGLIDNDFKLLERFDFEANSNNDGENIIFYRKGKPPVSARPQTESRKIQNPPHAQELLVEDIMEVCGDKKSLDFYKLVAKYMPEQQIYQTISEVKEIRDLGEVKKSKGAIFTKLIKDKANLLNINIFKNSKAQKG